MTVFRVGMKLRTVGPSRGGLQQFVPVLHRWIQRALVDGPLVDVVDYSHVSRGPGVVLVAFDANYSIGLSDGCLGVVWSRKRPTGSTLEDTLVLGAKKVVALCAELEAETELEGRLVFDGSVVRIFSNDRLLAPNTAVTEEQWCPALKGVARAFWGECELAIERVSCDPRERFCVDLSAGRSASVRELGARLECHTPE